MTRLSKLKAELARLRKELEFVNGQLHNESALLADDLAELSEKDIYWLELKNQKLMTEVIQLETLLEDL